MDFCRSRPVASVVVCYRFSTNMAILTYSLKQSYMVFHLAILTVFWKNSYKIFYKASHSVTLGEFPQIEKLLFDGKGTKFSLAEVF